MTTPAQDIELGRAAAELQNNSTFKALWARLDAEYTEQWKQSTNPQEREALHAKACALTDLNTALRIFIDNGERAKIEIEQKKLVDR